VQAPWIGDGRARLGPVDVRRALALVTAAEVAGGAILILIGAGTFLAGLS
jgi:hypothetical protein